MMRGMPRITLLASAALLTFGIWSLALLDPDEGRYAASSREMLRGGDLIVPTFNGEPRLNKPPLIYWLQAASFRLLGVNETAARLPSLVAALGTLALTGWWARRRLDASSGAVSVMVLATLALFFACARLAITDMLLALFVTATLILWHEAVEASEPDARRRLAFAASLSCGLAVLAKGPVGFALPSLVILSSRGLRVGPSGRMVTLRGVGMAIAGQALVVGPWLAGVTGRVGYGEILEILRREAYERAAWGLDHPRPFYYLLLTFWVTFLPWSLAAPHALIQGIRRGQRFLVVWFLVVVIFFTLISDKNDAYLLPAAPPLALLIARALPRRLIQVAACLMAVCLLAATQVLTPRLSRDRSLEQAVASADLVGRAPDILVSYKLYKPSLVFYSGREVRWIRTGADLRRLVSQESAGRSVAVVLEERRLGKERPGGFEIIGRQPGYVMVFRGRQP